MSSKLKNEVNLGIFLEKPIHFQDIRVVAETLDFNFLLQLLLHLMISQAFHVNLLDRN